MSNVRAAVSGVVLAGCLLLCGCGVDRSPVAFEATTPTAGTLGTIKGHTFGGQQPIVGAHVHVFSVGTGGYGGAATSLLTAANGTGQDADGYYVLTDSTGAFTIASAVACTAGTQAYLYSTGGNPGFGTNTAAGLLAPLGPCTAQGGAQPPASTNGFVQVNEVTTVVSAYALAGFASDPTHIASSGSTLAATGVANAMATALNLVNLSTGAVPATSVTGNATLPVARIYTLANALAACVNTAGPGSPACTTLFNDTGTASTGDTAVAAIAVAHTPFANQQDLFTLGTASTAPFAPVLTTAPADWTLGLQYGTPLYTTNLHAGTDTYANTYSAAVDASGNLWTRATNNLSTTASANTVTTFEQYSPLGAHLFETTYTGTASEPNNKFVHLGIDGQGYVWSGVTGGELRISTAGTAQYGCTNLGLPSSTVFDAGGNVYAGDFNDPTIFELSGGTGSAGTCTGTLSTSPLTSQGELAVTNDGHLLGSTYMSSNGGNASNDLLIDFTLSTPGTSTSYDAAGELIATDSGNDTWTFSTIGGTGLAQIYKYNRAGQDLSQNGYKVGPFAQNGVTATRGGTEGVHVDGAGAVWVGVSICTDTPNGCTVQPDVVAALQNDGTGLTPNAGLALPASETGAHALALDGSGNLWVALSDGSLIQYVGLATPVATPILPGNVGVRP